MVVSYIRSLIVDQFRNPAFLSPGPRGPLLSNHAKSWERGNYIILELGGLEWFGDVTGWEFVYMQDYGITVKRCVLASMDR